jgi:hypothetical protein
MKIKQTQKDLFVCSCHSTEHQMVVLYDEDEIDDVKYPMLYIHTHLVKRPFWQRVKYGLKYIFGYQCRYGAFDEFIINPDDVEGIEKIVKYLKECEI